MCSKKWAKPDLPGSTSLRDPVWTGIWSETRFGKPVGTTMTLRPFGRVVSVAWKGSRSLDISGPFGAGVAAWALAARAKAMAGTIGAVLRFIGLL
jgi:hypothetical protein